MPVPSSRLAALARAALLCAPLLACSSSHHVGASGESEDKAAQPDDDAPAADPSSPEPEDPPDSQPRAADQPPDPPNSEQQQPDDPGDVAELDQPLTYYKDVKPIFDQKCAQCHVEGGIGPFPLTSYRELKPLLPLIEADVAQGIMPPWRASGALDVFESDRRLDARQKSLVQRWIDQGAREGDPRDEPEHPPAQARGLPRIDQVLELPDAYTPLYDPDSYRCFVFEWPFEQTKFITGLGVVPEAPQLVHHAVVYLVSPEGAAAVRDKDEDQEGPGYDCFNAGNIGAWLTSYEPGGYGQELPGGVGMEVAPGSVIVLQMHYNTLHGKTSDRSRLELMLEDDAPRVGHTSLILNTLWVLGAMNIPSGETDVVQRWQGRPYDLRGAGLLDIFAVDLHMHTLATSGSIGIIRADGSSETLLDIPDWAFDWQETYRLRAPVRLDSSDQLFVECHYDNSAEHQLVVDGQRLSPRDVNWGEGTTDEMCLGNVLVTPALE